MANFSSFFPAAAAGGGGFTKMKKYSTFRALDDATNKLRPAPDFYVTSSPSSGANTLTGNMQGYSGSVLNATDAYVGMTFVWNSTTHTITASTANSGQYGDVTWTFSPTLTASIPYNQDIYPTDSNITVNPATDLGLSDGDSIGFLLAGGNATGVLRGTAIITTASTDLVCTPGLSSGTASTITGGLTLTSADGSLSNSIGYLSTVENSGYSSFMRTRVAAGQGIDGYGVGQQFSGTQSQGFGGYGVDGAVLLYY